MKKPASKKTLVNVLGVVYVHTRTSDGGDLYLTRYADKFEKHLDTRNWYETKWFEKNRERLLGTSSVYRVPTKKVQGSRLDLVVKNCRVGEDVPFNTRTLEEFVGAEFNSPWEEFSLVMEMGEGRFGPEEIRMRTQEPLAIYIPPEKMQFWQSGRSRAKINKIHARHPGIDLDILKQYKLIYGWIKGRNLIEVFETIDMDPLIAAEHIREMDSQVAQDMSLKGYLMADMKPEHVIIDEADAQLIEELGRARVADPASGQVETLRRLVDIGRYYIIDYELLFMSPEHEDMVKSLRRHSYLDDQRDRFTPTDLPEHLSTVEILGTPYIYGHTESTDGRLWVVGRNARLFDYFLPERWRKTPAFEMSADNDVFYTLTKDNIHLVWKTSRVGEIPEEGFSGEEREKIRKRGVNSPFEEFSLAQELNSLGIHCVYVRAIYMTGSTKMEQAEDQSRYLSHRDIRGPGGISVLLEDHDYITIRGYYNGPDDWVPEHDEALLSPINLDKAVTAGIIKKKDRQEMHEEVLSRLSAAGFEGSMLRTNDLIIATDQGGAVVRREDGRPDVIITNLEFIWRNKATA